MTEIELEVGRVFELILDGVAHGGYAVGRLAGRVVFVRGGIPGETVRVRLNRRGTKGRFWYGDVVEVLNAALERVEHPWPAAQLPLDSDQDHPAQEPVGGLDLGHVSLAGGRKWKSAVITDQLRRLGRITWPDVEVEAVPGDADRGGLQSRTRVQLAVDSQGRAGMRPQRSHDVIALDQLPIAVPSFAELDVFSRTWPAGSKLQIALPNDSDPFIAVDGQPWPRRRSGPVRKYVNEQVSATVAGERVTQRFQVAGTGFWQVHRAAPELLVAAVLDAAQLQPGDSVVDLYSGVGLFSAFLARAVGSAGRVVAIESDELAVRCARRNFHDQPHVELIAGDVRRIARRGELPRVSVAVLDPPRAGAGAEVIRALVASGPRKIVHVSCDPATFARDVATYYELGWQMRKLRAFDIYPLTHHVETLAVFEPLVS